MKLIIDIPEDIKVAIDQMGLLRIPNEMQKKVDKAIQYGTPLPKGHGRLGDLDALKDFCTGREIGNSLTGEILVTVGHYKDGDEINKKLFSEEIAPTIIEADKTVIEKEVQFERIWNHTVDEMKRRDIGGTE